MGASLIWLVVLYPQQKTCLTPIPLKNTKPIGTLRGSLSGINMVQTLEVCLGMVQVSFVVESTTDLVGCSDQHDISVRREERSRMDLVRVGGQKFHLVNRSVMFG